MDKNEKKLVDELRHKAHMMGPLHDLKEMLNRAESNFTGRTAMVEKQNKTEVVSYTITRLVSDVNAVGTALLSMGLKGKHIAVLGENSYRWVVSFLAVVCGVGVAVPLDKDLGDEDLSKLMTKSDAEAVFCSKTYYKTLKEHIKNDERMKNVFVWNKKYDDEGFMTFDELVKKGNELIKNGDRSYIDAVIDNNAVAAIVFTSGTTGANKGVMLSHKNFATNVDGIIDTIPTEYTSFSLLPMNHVFELSCNIFTALYMNATIYVNDSLKNILPNIQLFKPDAMNAVPLVLEGIYNGIWAAAKERGKAEPLKKLVKLSNKLRSHGIDLRKVLFASIRKNFGDKFPTLVCGGAPSRADYVSGLGDFGFRVYNGYGLTESSPTVTLNMHADDDPTSAGFAFPKSKFIIHAPDADGIGEIWIKGDNVTQGYYKDPKATAESFEDGWFKTGDYGRVTDKGELFVSGRKKTLIILDNGKNVFPEDIEFFAMDNLSYIREAVALELEKEIRGRTEKIIGLAVYIEPSDFDNMSEKEIKEKVEKDIFDLNRRQPSYKKVQDVAVVTKEFPKNSTRKIIRQKVADSYESYKQ